MQEVDELVACGVDILAVQGTGALRPNGQTSAEFIRCLLYTSDNLSWYRQAAGRELHRLRPDHGRCRAGSRAHHHRVPGSTR